MKTGSPTLTIDGAGLRVAVIAASWHETVMAGLVSGLFDAGLLGAGRGHLAAAGDHAGIHAGLDRAVRASSMTVTRRGAFAPTRKDLGVAAR